jgi:hypothetical protein
MGHTKPEFDTMLKSLKVEAWGEKHPALKTISGQPKELPRPFSCVPSPLLDLAKSIAEVPSLLKRIETHSFELAHEFLKAQSGNFTRKDIHFDADGLVVLYHCSRDDRTYTVKITASK